MAEIRTKIYNQFRGVDFSSDDSLVEAYRSPVARNIISDSAGMPEKRPGWRTVAKAAGNQQVHGFWDAVIKNQTFYIAHIGTGIYLFDPKPENPGDTEGTLTLLTGCKGNQRSVALNLLGKLWILTGSEFLVFDGKTVKPVCDVAYVPTTSIHCKPSGERQSYESYNMLTGKRINTFVGDGTSKTYPLETTEIDAVEWVAVNGTAYGPDSTGTYAWTADLAAGTVTFSAAPPAPSSGAGDNVVIQYSKVLYADEAEGKTYLDVINSCTILSSFGIGTRDRLVLSGNPDYKNRDWTSGFEDPTYFPDLLYNTVGSEATAIVGYAPISSYMAIIKEDNGQDATIYMRSAGLDDDGDALFPTVQSVSGVGGIAKGCVGLINDEPVFLNSLGLYAITSHIITAERVVQNRSYFVNSMLTREKNLADAVCCRWNGYFIIGVNGKCYILDGLANKCYSERNNANSFVYECYYWDNVPASCFLVHRDHEGETLWFGTEDGRICRFNTDIDGVERYNDDGEAVKAVWATKADDDGDATREKTMIKQGAAVTLKPYKRGGAEIWLRTDRDSVERYLNGRSDLFDFEDIDFERFSFDTNNAPKEIFFRTKVKKYKRLQIIVKNEGVNEGFGVFAITKHFVVGNFARR